MSVRSAFKEFKDMTGKRGADLAEKFGYTRQYISLLANSPTNQNNYKLAWMMEAAMIDVIKEKEKELSDLVDLHEKIVELRHRSA